MSLFDGTTRVAQIAFAIVIAATLISFFAGAAGGNVWLGPMMFAVAGAMSFFTFARDREDFSMWPAYATFAIVIVGMLLSVPMIFTANDKSNVKLDGKAARDEMITQQPSIQRALSTCVKDRPDGCSAYAVSSTQEGINSGIRNSEQCTQERTVCVSDSTDGKLRWMYVTRPVKKIGMLVIEQVRMQDGSVVSTVCQPVMAGADTDLVALACGDEGAVGTAVITE